VSPRRQRLTTIVLMGVAGSGKSSVMQVLARELGWPTLEGDTVHPPGNVAKMAAGEPLSDADRAPWLEAIASWIAEREGERSSSILTCSALRRSYRDVLRRGQPSVWFVHLVAPVEVLEARMRARRGHFMPPSMLASQLATLEPLAHDEPGSTVDATQPPESIADRIIAALALAWIRPQGRSVRGERSSRKT
jgi:gluconokinase